MCRARDIVSVLSERRSFRISVKLLTTHFVVRVLKLVFAHLAAIVVTDQKDRKMDELIADQIEWLLSNYGTSNRLGRQLVTLVGFLGSAGLPENISKQTAALSRLIVQQDAFDSLIHSLDTMSKRPVSLRAEAKDGEPMASQEPTRLLDQIESVRREISEADAVNYSEIICWIVGQAKEQKIFRQKTRR